MNRPALALLLALGACSEPKRSGVERPPAPADPAPPLAQAPPQQPAQLSQDELSQQLSALGSRRGDELRKATARANDEDIAAQGPCQRPGAAERAALRRRVLAWIDQTTARSEHPTEKPEQLSLRFGCVEPAGIVIAAQMDRESKQRTRTHEPDVGHWWTLRATRASLAVLSETRGIATRLHGEWADEKSQATIALADLDGDGVLDPLVAQSDHVGGANSKFAIGLSVVPSRTNRRTAIAAFGDEVVPVLVPGAPRSGPIALEIGNHRTERRVVRCVDATLALARCAEAALARRGEALEIARRLTALEETPDREELAEWLDLLGVPPAEAAPLLAASTPPSPQERAARKIRRFLGPDEDRTNTEQDDDARREATAMTAALHSDLGAAACDRTSPAAGAAVRGFLKTAAPGATEVSIRGQCTGTAGTYVAAAWWIEEHRSDGVFFVQGARVTQVGKARLPPLFDHMHSGAPLLHVSFYRSGAAVIALVVAPHDEQPSELTAIVDGRTIARRTGDLTHDSEVLVAEQAAGGTRRYLHATATALIEVAAFPAPTVQATAPAGSPAAQRLFAREQEHAARDLLTSATPVALGDPAQRADLVRALAHLGAPPALIDEVSRLR